MKTILPFLFLSILLSTGLPASDLPRRGALGTALEPISDSLAMANGINTRQGVAIQYVVEGGTGHSLGLQAGDIILRVNGEKTTQVSQVVNLIGSYQKGDNVRIDILRSGKPIFLKGNLKGFPAESSPSATVIYDAVAFDGGLLRTIIHKPEAAGRLPAVFFIQGYGCSSIDNMHPHGALNRLLQGFTENGFVVIKTEKPGIGDSRNDNHCSEIDLFTEIDAFSASYNDLKKYDFIDHDNVFVFGFSLGGVVAPLLKTDIPPRGVAVFGTVVRPWFEYFVEMIRWQRLINGQDYIANELNFTTGLKFMYRFMIEKQTPEELEADAKMAPFLRSFWDYGDEGTMLGRNYRFWQQLQETRLFEAWSKTPAYVLSLWGEGDLAAFNPKEHELIADIVNHYNPGKARFVTVPNTDHSLNYVKDQRHSAEIRNDWAYLRDNYNPAVINITTDWMMELLTEADPVRAN